VESTAAVSVLVMDWTTTGAPPPTITSPTFTPTVMRRSSGRSRNSNIAVKLVFACQRRNGDLRPSSTNRARAHDKVARQVVAARIPEHEDRDHFAVSPLRERAYTAIATVRRKSRISWQKN